MDQNSNNGATSSLDLVWGAANIARTIGRTPRATYHALESGQIPGAAKIAGRWCLSPSKFVAAFDANSVAA